MSGPAEDVSRRLAEPFAASEVKWKPAVVQGNRAMALAYVDARVVQDRLDDVMGPMNWQDDYECLSDGSVVCRLRLRLAGEWITKVDVGSPSEQPDEHDRMKAAFSDALKRAAVKFGVGRFLYRLPSQWVDYDPQKKRFVKPPQLPAALAANGTHAPPAGRPKIGQSGPKAGQAIDAAQYQELDALLKATGSDVQAFLKAYHVGAITSLPVEHFTDARGKLQEKKARQDRIASLMKEKGASAEDVAKWTRDRWQQDDYRRLTGAQAAELIADLEELDPMEQAPQQEPAEEVGA